MNARRLALLAAVAVLAASGGYVFVYLYRWEWNRAMVSGIIFLAAEVGFVGALVIGRLSRLNRRLGELDRAPAEIDTRVLRRFQENVPAPAKPFAWLNRSQTNVFVPVFLGAGFVLSDLAWVVDRIARATAGPVIARGLARSLGALGSPPGGLLGEPPAEPFRPRSDACCRSPPSSP